jgi:hypothetical protein
MSHYIGPNGRLYKRERPRGKWVALTIIAFVVIVTAIAGLPPIASAFSWIGL